MKKPKSLILSDSPEELRKKFFSLSDRRGIASLLDLSYEDLIYYAYRMKSKYTTFDIAKKNRQERRIQSPDYRLKILQRKLNQVFSAVYVPKRSTYGYITGRNIVENARRHTRKRAVLNLDLKDFFPSINFGRVQGMLKARPYNLPAPVATLLAHLCCYDGCLPQGAPTSPIISNMICAKLDGNLEKFSRINGCFYSRYADDLTFSTNKPSFPETFVTSNPTDGAVEIGRPLRDIIENNGFAINEEKVKLRDHRRRQIVTGLIVNTKVNVRRRFLSQIRAMLHAWEKYGPVEAFREHIEKYQSKHRMPERPMVAFERVVSGKIGFVKEVRGEHDPIYAKLRRKYLKLCGPRRWGIPRRQEERILDKLWILEVPNQSQGTGFELEGFGLVTCAHVYARGIVAFHRRREGERYRVALERYDKLLDLAVLRIEGRAESNNTFKAAMDYEPEPGDMVTIAGFPNHNVGDRGAVYRTRIATDRLTASGSKRLLIEHGIIYGMSGGPVLNESGEVIGVMARGAESVSASRQTEKNEVILISELPKVPVISRG